MQRQNKTLKLNKFQQQGGNSCMKTKSWLIYLTLLTVVGVLYVQKENELTDLSGMIRLKDDDIKNKDIKITSLENEMTTTAERIKSLETERDTIKGHNNALQLQVDTLTKKLETAHEKVDNIHVALKGLHDHFQDLDDDEKEEQQEGGGRSDEKNMKNNNEIKLLSFDVDMVDGVLSHEIILQTIQQYITKAVVNFLNDDEDYKDILDTVELVYIDKEKYKVGGIVKFKASGSENENAAKYPKKRDIHNLQIHALEDTKALDVELKKAKDAADNGSNNNDDNNTAETEGAEGKAEEKGTEGGEEVAETEAQAQEGEGEGSETTEGAAGEGAIAEEAVTGEATEETNSKRKNLRH